jgi:methionyl aminopeptidase
MINIKRPEDIERMRESARIVAEALDLAESLIAPGAVTREIDGKIEELLRARGAVPSFLGYHGYPAATCISVNQAVVHGIPGDRRLEEGDIVSIDVGALKQGFHGDAARTFAVGQISPEAAKLLRVTEEALMAGIKAIQLQGRLGAVSHAIQSHAEAEGFSVVRDLVGHGIGRKLHEEPQVPNFGPAESGPVIREGMVLAIEPMVNQGGWEVYTLEDQWTVVTRDGKLSAHFEHTVAVAAHGPEILSLCGARVRG